MVLSRRQVPGFSSLRISFSSVTSFALPGDAVLISTVSEQKNRLSLKLGRRPHRTAGQGKFSNKITRTRPAHFALRFKMETDTRRVEHPKCPSGTELKKVALLGHQHSLSVEVPCSSCASRECLGNSPCIANTTRTEISTELIPGRSKSASAS